MGWRGAGGGGDEGLQGRLINGAHNSFETKRHCLRTKLNLVYN